VVGADVGADERGTWLSRAVKLGIAAIAAASLGLAGLLVPWSDLLSSGPPQAHVSPGGTVSWEAEGWVKNAAPSTNSIRVSSGFLGLSSLTLIVPLDTLIMVAGKEGGFDDLHEGRRVRAIYEARPTGLRAKSIEVLVEGAQSEGRRASESVIGMGGGRSSSPADARRSTEKVAPTAKLTDQRIIVPSPPSTTPDTRSPTGASAPAATPADAQTGARADVRKPAPAAKPAEPQLGAQTLPPSAAETRTATPAPKPAEPQTSARPSLPGAETPAAAPAPKPAEPQTSARTSSPTAAEARAAAPAPKPAEPQTSARTSPPAAEIRNSGGIAASVPKPVDVRRPAREEGPRAIPSATRLTEPAAARSARDESSVVDRRTTVPPIPSNEGSPRAGSAEPRQTQVSDPGAVIDWLLKASPTSD
jgi:hypothetical protein